MSASGLGRSGHRKEYVAPTKESAAVVIPLIPCPLIQSTGYLLSTAVNYCQEYSFNMNYSFTSDMLCICSPYNTDAASTTSEITSPLLRSPPMTDPASVQETFAFTQTRMCIIDDLNFQRCDEYMAIIDLNLRRFTQCEDRLFGNMAVVFFGDFAQIPGIRRRWRRIRWSRFLPRGPNDEPFWVPSLTAVVKLSNLQRRERRDRHDQSINSRIQA